jgi:hypothetical protein
MMKSLLIAATLAGATLVAAPASAQVFIGADDSGAGVQVGPLGVGVGPRFGYDHRATTGTYVYAPGECRILRERIVTPSGRVIYRRHRECY